MKIIQSIYVNVKKLHRECSKKSIDRTKITNLNILNSHLRDQLEDTSKEFSEDPTDDLLPQKLDSLSKLIISSSPIDLIDFKEELVKLKQASDRSKLEIKALMKKSSSSAAAADPSSSENNSQSPPLNDADLLLRAISSSSSPGGRSDPKTVLREYIRLLGRSGRSEELGEVLDIIKETTVVRTPTTKGDGHVEKSPVGKVLTKDRQNVDSDTKERSKSTPTTTTTGDQVCRTTSSTKKKTVVKSDDGDTSSDGDSREQSGSAESDSSSSEDETTSGGDSGSSIMEEDDISMEETSQSSSSMSSSSGSSVSSSSSCDSLSSLSTSSSLSSSSSTSSDDGSGSENREGEERNSSRNLVNTTTTEEEVKENEESPNNESEKESSNSSENVVESMSVTKVEKSESQVNTPCRPKKKKKKRERDMFDIGAVCVDHSEEDDDGNQQHSETDSDAVVEESNNNVSCSSGESKEDSESSSSSNSMIDSSPDDVEDGDGSVDSSSPSDASSNEKSREDASDNDDGDDDDDDDDGKTSSTEEEQVERLNDILLRSCSNNDDDDDDLTNENNNNVVGGGSRLLRPGTVERVSELFPQQKEAISFMNNVERVAIKADEKLCLERQKKGLIDESHVRGTIIAADMGQGKTVMILNTHYEANKGITDKKLMQRSILICPPDLIASMSAECKRHFRNFSFLKFDRSHSLKLVQQYSFIVVSYKILYNHYIKDGGRVLFRKGLFQRVFIDEAHAIKNIDSKTGAVILAFSKLIPLRHAFTGTPMGNSLIEILPLLQFIGAPLTLEESKKSYWSNISSLSHVKKLMTIIQRYVFRSKNNRVYEDHRIDVPMNDFESLEYIKELENTDDIISQNNKYKEKKRKQKLQSKSNRPPPPKTDIHVTSEWISRIRKISSTNENTGTVHGDDRPHDSMSSDTAKLSSSHQSPLSLLLSNPERPPVNIEDDLPTVMNLGNRILVQISKLRQICSFSAKLCPTISYSHPRYAHHHSRGFLKKFPGQPSSKMIQLKDVLDKFPKEDKFLVFSQFTDTIRSFYHYFTTVHGTKCLFFTGETKVGEERTRIIADFQNKRKGYKILFLTIGSGGQGLNLQGANVAVLLEPGMNPQTDKQGKFRINRPGQEKCVFCITFAAVLCVKVNDDDDDVSPPPSLPSSSKNPNNSNGGEDDRANSSGPGQKVLYKNTVETLVALKAKNKSTLFDLFVDNIICEEMALSAWEKIKRITIHSNKTNNDMKKYSNKQLVNDSLKADIFQPVNQLDEWIENSRIIDQFRSRVSNSPMGCSTMIPSMLRKLTVIPKDTIFFSLDFANIPNLLTPSHYSRYMFASLDLLCRFLLSVMARVGNFQIGQFIQDLKEIETMYQRVHNYPPGNNVQQYIRYCGSLSRLREIAEQILQKDLLGEGVPPIAPPHSSSQHQQRRPLKINPSDSITSHRIWNFRVRIHKTTSDIRLRQEGNTEFQMLYEPKPSELTRTARGRPPLDFQPDWLCRVKGIDNVLICSRKPIAGEGKWFDNDRYHIIDGFQLSTVTELDLSTEIIQKMVYSSTLRKNTFPQLTSQSDDLSMEIYRDQLFRDTIATLIYRQITGDDDDDQQQSTLPPPGGDSESSSNHDDNKETTQEQQPPQPPLGDHTRSRFRPYYHYDHQFLVEKGTDIPTVINCNPQPQYRRFNSFSLNASSILVLNAIASTWPILSSVKRFIQVEEYIQNMDVRHVCTSTRDHLATGLPTIGGSLPPPPPPQQPQQPQPPPPRSATLHPHPHSTPLSLPPQTTTTMTATIPPGAPLIDRLRSIYRGPSSISYSPYSTSSSSVVHHQHQHRQHQHQFRIEPLKTPILPIIVGNGGVGSSPPIPQQSTDAGYSSLALYRNLESVMRMGMRKPEENRQPCEFVCKKKKSPPRITTTTAMETSPLGMSSSTDIPQFPRLFLHLSKESSSFTLAWLFSIIGYDSCITQNPTVIVHSSNYPGETTIPVDSFIRRDIASHIDEFLCSVVSMVICRQLRFITEMHQSSNNDSNGRGVTNIDSSSSSSSSSVDTEVTSIIKAPSSGVVLTFEDYLLTNHILAYLMNECVNTRRLSMMIKKICSSKHLYDRWVLPPIECEVRHPWEIQGSVSISISKLPFTTIKHSENLTIHWSIDSSSLDVN